MSVLPFASSVTMKFPLNVLEQYLRLVASKYEETPSFLFVCHTALIGLCKLKVFFVNLLQYTQRDVLYHDWANLERKFAPTT
jgi:hypothetical protein